MLYYVFPADKPLHFVNIGHYVSDADYIHPKRIMKDYEVFVVMNGNLFVEQNATKYEVGAKQMLFNLPNMVHGGWKHAFSDYFWFHFTCESLPKTTDEKQLAESFGRDANAFDRQIIVPQQFSFSDWNNIGQLLGQCFNMCRSGYPQTANDYLVTTLMLEITTQLREKFLPQKQKLSAKINAMLAYIEDNKHNKITVKDLAEYFQYNDKYLSTLFLTKIGITPKAYIMSRKMEFAKDMLRVSTDKVKDIAFYCSFEDERLFMRVFKKYVGMTPTEYRNSFRE